MTNTILDLIKLTLFNILNQFDSKENCDSFSLFVKETQLLYLIIDYIIIYEVPVLYFNHFFLLRLKYLQLQFYININMI